MESEEMYLGRIAKRKAENRLKNETCKQKLCGEKRMNGSSRCEKHRLPRFAYTSVN